MPDEADAGCWGWPGCCVPDGWLRARANGALGSLTIGIDVVCGGAPGRALVAADLEGQRRAVRVADVDPQPVLDVDGRDPAAVDEQAVEAAVVDGDPSALVEAQHQVGPGDQGVGDAHVGAQVTADDYIVACGEGAFGSVIPNGQRGRGWSTHRDQL